MTVEAEKLAKRYPGNVWGAREITFTAEKGKITILLGPNGAGKTTTIGMLTTILKPTKGIARVMGYSVVEDKWKVRELIALCPQDIRVDYNWSPLDALKGYLTIRGFSKEEVKDRAERYLKYLDLWNVKDKPSIQLSGGQRKRIAVAMVLASDSPVIFLDEPSAGLDVEGKYIVWKTLREEANKGKTIILTTHDMREAEIIGDYIVMISGGKSVAKGTVEELKSRVPYRYKLVIKELRSMPFREHINLGDRKIVYAETKEDLMSKIEKIDARSVGVEEIGLEDAYLHIIGGANYEKN